MKKIIIPIILLLCACASKENDPIKLSLLAYHNSDAINITEYKIDTITVADYCDSVMKDLFAFTPYKDRLQWARNIAFSETHRKVENESMELYAAADIADKLLENFEVVDSLDYDYLYSFFYLKNYSNKLLGLDRIMPKEYTASVMLLEKIKNDEPIYRRLKEIRAKDSNDIVCLKVFYKYTIDVAGNNLPMDGIKCLDSNLKVISE